MRGGEGFVVPGRRPLADQNLHSAGDGISGLVRLRALVVSGDAGGGVCGAAGAPQPRRVAVHRLACTLCGCNLRHHLRVAVQDARVVHHLGEDNYFIALQQGCNSSAVKACAGGLDAAPAARHAARGPESEMEVCRGSIIEHQLHAFDAQDIGNLVRVADRADGAVAFRDSSELCGQHHRALDVDVRIDESRQVVWGIPVDRAGRDRRDAAVPGRDLRVSDPPRHKVNHVT